MPHLKFGSFAGIFIIFVLINISLTARGKSDNSPAGVKDSVKIYVDLGSAYETTNPIQSIGFYLSALRLADGETKIDILNRLVNQYESTEQPQLAAKYELETFKEYGKLLNIKNGPDKIPVLLALGNEHLKQNNDSSLYYNNKAYELSRTYNMPVYIGRSLENLGDTYTELGNQSKALEFYRGAIKIFVAKNDSITITSLTWKIGKIFLGFKLYNQALEYELNSLKMARKINSKMWIYNSLRILTTIYYQKNEPAKGKEFANKLVYTARRNGDYPFISLMYFTLGKYYYSKKNYKKAVENFEFSSRLRSENKEPYDKLIISYENLGLSYRKLKDYPNALKYFNAAYNLCRNLNYRLLTQRVQKELGITYKYMGDYKNSIAFLKESIRTAQMINYPKNIASGFKELSLVYSETKDYKNAYEVLKKYLTIQDSLWSVNYQKGVDQYKNIYISEKKAKEFEALKTKSKNELLIAFTIIFILSLLISIILYSRYRYKVRSNNILKKNADEISKALEEVNQLNEVLKVSETTYRYLFENNPMPMIIWASNTLKIKSANFAAMGLYGYSQEEFLEMSINDVFEKNQKEKTNFGQMSKYLAKIENVKHVKKNGMDMDVEMITHPLIFDGNRSYNAMINDVTEKKHVENAIIESERRLSRAQKIAHVGNWEIDLKTKTVWGSEEAFLIYGFDRNKISNPSYDDIKTIPVEEDRDKLDTAMFELLTMNKEYNVEFSVHKKDTDEMRVVKSTAEVIRNEKGEPVKVTGVIRDITEIKNYQKELIEAKERAERSDKLKSDFLAQMSHEIRSPVNTILSFTSLLKEELNGNINEDIEICFNSIDSGGRRLIRTIDLILNTADIQSGKYEPFMEKTALGNDIIKNLIMEFTSAANAKGLKINFNNNLVQSKLYLDRYTVTQIFANLIDNAIKYTKTGSIDIILNQSQEEVSVKISDTGIGISKDYIPRLFDPFSQEEQGYARRFEGTGLGLSLVKKYCDLNNAIINVDSTKGNGTTFTVTFPAQIEFKNDIVSEVENS